MNLRQLNDAMAAFHESQRAIYEAEVRAYIARAVRLMVLHSRSNAFELAWEEVDESKESETP